MLPAGTRSGRTQAVHPAVLVQPPDHDVKFPPLSGAHIQLRAVAVDLGRARAEMAAQEAPAEPPLVGIPAAAAAAVADVPGAAAEAAVGVGAAAAAAAATAAMPAAAGKTALSVGRGAGWAVLPWNVGKARGLITLGIGGLGLNLPPEFIALQVGLASGCIGACVK